MRLWLPDIAWAVGIRPRPPASSTGMNYENDGIKISFFLVGIS